MKKSQVTLFMLFGILIMLSVGFFVIVVNEEKQKITEETTPIQTYVEQCIEDVARRGIVYVAMQGGYYKTSEPYYQLGSYEIAYAMYDNESTIISEEEIEKQIGMYVDETLDQCIANFSTLMSQGYEITATNPRTTTSMQENSVVFSVEYPITVTHESSTTTYNRFTVGVPSDLYRARVITQEIINTHSDNTKIPLSKLNQITEKYNVTMDLGNFNTTVIYAITLPEHPTLFRFGVQYVWGGYDE